MNLEFSDKETFVCNDCHSVGPLNANGKCATCDSDSVYSSNLFPTGDKPNVYIGSSKANS